MMRLIFTLFIVFTVFAGYAQDDWTVPEEALGKTSPFKFTEETQNAGKQIYMNNCKSCHGLPTQNNFVPLTPPPGDMSTERFSSQKDGALFYKITNGKGPMPTFKNQLTKEQRWEVISFIRTFHEGYIQPELQEASGPVAGGVKLSLEYMEGDSTVQVTAVAADSLAKPVAGVEITLFAQRYFGNLPVGEPVLTNDMGLAAFKVPEELPGDTAGNIEFIARATNLDAGEVEAKEVLLAGVPTNKPSLTEKRAMWNTMAKAPLWVLLSYTLVVLTVFAILGYIVMQVLKIRKL